MLIPVVLLLSWDAAGCVGAGSGSEPGRQVLRDSWRASTFATSPADPRVPERASLFGDTEGWQWIWGKGIADHWWFLQSKFPSLWIQQQFDLPELHLFFVTSPPKGAGTAGLPVPGTGQELCLSPGDKGDVRVHWSRSLTKVRCDCVLQDEVHNPYPEQGETGIKGKPEDTGWWCCPRERGRKGRCAPNPREGSGEETGICLWTVRSWPLCTNGGNLLSVENEKPGTVVS